MADPNFAPFDPADLSPPLDPRERVKRGFERLRVEDRTAPGYPGAFLHQRGTLDFSPTNAWDPPEQRSSYLLGENAPEIGHNFSSPMAAGLGTEAQMRAVMHKAYVDSIEQFLRDHPLNPTVYTPDEARKKLGKK